MKWVDGLCVSVWTNPFGNPKIKWEGSHYWLLLALNLVSLGIHKSFKPFLEHLSGDLFKLVVTKFITLSYMWALSLKLMYLFSLFFFLVGRLVAWNSPLKMDKLSVWGSNPSSCTYSTMSQPIELSSWGHLFSFIIILI
jgi:hypothetical protein